MWPRFQRHVSMNQSVCAAPTKLATNERKMMAVRALAGAEPVSTLAARHGVSRPLVYRQMHKASAALDDLFSTEQTEDRNKVLHWQAVDGLAKRIRRHLRPLYVALDFAGTVADNPWLAALAWAKCVFAKQQRLSQRPLAECPAATLPKRLRPYLLTFDTNGKPTGLHADRYEFWL
jgi:hypothetical protein